MGNKLIGKRKGYIAQEVDYSVSILGLIHILYIFRHLPVIIFYVYFKTFCSIMDVLPPFFSSLLCLLHLLCTTVNSSPPLAFTSAFVDY